MEREATSVLIINNNCGGYVARAIEGAFGQHDPDVKIIVVDDGRTDQSCATPEAHGYRAKVLVQKNREQVAAIVDARIRLRLAIDGFSFVGEPNLSGRKRDALRAARYLPGFGLDVGLPEAVR